MSQTYMALMAACVIAKFYFFQDIGYVKSIVYLSTYSLRFENSANEAQYSIQNSLPKLYFSIKSVNAWDCNNNRFANKYFWY